MNATGPDTRYTRGSELPVPIGTGEVRKASVLPRITSGAPLAGSSARRS
ncbi:MAG TPA: hypothetical protein VNQ80_01140 [Parapedobacter sp.]|nr:hypothetical protein [Parapedobacter sp.]HWK55907.1 hypothetical protein [Parapedobacter sp.]